MSAAFVKLAYQMKNHILIMTKFPRVGEVNTRMIPDIGAEKATAVHRKMAEHIIEVTGDLISVKRVIHIANSSEDEADEWLGQSNWIAQRGEDLGERMANAITHSMEQGAEKVLVVGTDCPLLNGDIFEQTLEALEDFDVVYVPAHDGGYVLIGMNDLQDAAFRDIDWGTEHVLDQSLHQLRGDGITYKLLKPLSDIDFAKDIPSQFL